MVNNMEQVNLQALQKLCVDRQILWRDHALQRMRERNIKRADIINCICTGEIIEHYPEDYPVPSCLVFGITVSNKYLHVVCSVYNNIACIISAYYPDTIHWESDFKTRKVVK